jgi:hypothetical protein
MVVRKSSVWGRKLTDVMSFELVVAAKECVCTCICGHHHPVNSEARCVQFIQPEQSMYVGPEGQPSARRCLPCAVAAGIAPKIVLRQSAVSRTGWDGKP